jgi:AcrR family transcriptional regulator
VTQQAADYRQATARHNIQAILDAAEDLLERRARTSIVAVAAAAGVSRVTVYAHFRTWEALLEAVVERAVARTTGLLDAARPDAGPPLEAVERMLAAGWLELSRNAAMAQAAAEQLSPDTLTRTHQAALSRIGDLVARGRQDGSFRTDLPAAWLITSTLALIHACASEVRAGRIDQDSAPQILLTTIRGLLTGRDAGQTASHDRPGPAGTQQGGTRR